MPSFPSADQIKLAPLTGTSDARTEQYLTGTSQSVAVTLPLQPGSFATIKVSADTEVAARWGSTTPSATTTNLEIGAGETFDWLVETTTQYVALVAADGASTFEAWVWTSSSLR